MQYGRIDPARETAESRLEVDPASMGLGEDVRAYAAKMIRRGLSSFTPFSVQETVSPNFPSIYRPDYARLRAAINLGQRWPGMEV